MTCGKMLQPLCRHDGFYSCSILNMARNPNCNIEHSGRALLPIFQVLSIVVPLKSGNEQYSPTIELTTGFGAYYPRRNYALPASRTGANRTVLMRKHYMPHESKNPALTAHSGWYQKPLPYHSRKPWLGWEPKQGTYGDGQVT